MIDWDEERELRRVPWTEDEDDIIRELSHKGAVAIADEIWDRLGIERTPHSVECRASKIHRSLRRLAQCPMCGAIGVHLNRQTGLCRGCNESYRLEEERAYHEQLELERWEAEEGPDVERVMKEREALRQRNARLRRKYHLKDKRTRKRGK